MANAWAAYVIYFTGKRISSGKTVRATSESHAKRVAKEKWPHRRVLTILKK